MSQLVTNLAQAIDGAMECRKCQALVFDGANSMDCGCAFPSWDEASPQNKARAALLVMRQPTADVVEACPDHWLTVWRRMIDLAAGVQSQDAA